MLVILYLKKRWKLCNTGVTLERHTIDIDAYHRMIEAGILTEDDRVELIHGEIIRVRRGRAPLR
ncbi:MAG: hypothetical protein WBA23_16390 [Tunicatimonas sp.]|uniref:hypothetical protein n=1 Tax=Tunicatimonas sp. TaxID=1940096 RepID=UPI003C76DD4B